MEAAADESTIKISSFVRAEPNPLVPNMEFPSTDSTSLALFEFSSPTPVVPMPA